MTMSIDRAKTLSSPMIKFWGLALKMCRLERNFRHRDVAKFVGVSEGIVQLWELATSDDGPYPSRRQLKRLGDMMHKLRKYDYLVPELALNAADKQEKANELEQQAKRQPPPALAKPAPAPPSLPVRRSLADAFSILRRTRSLSAREIQQATGIPVASVYLIEKGGEHMSRQNYDRLITAYPELATAIPPPLTDWKPGASNPRPLPEPPKAAPTKYLDEFLASQPPAPAPGPQSIQPMPEPGVATFAAAVRVARVKRGLGQTSFGRLAGVTGSSISKIERGTGGDTITATTYKALMTAFPELADAPLPQVHGGQKRLEYARGFLSIPKADATAASPAPAPAVAAPAATSAAPTAELTGAAGLAHTLTVAYGRLAAATKRADETMAEAMKADEEKKAAQAAVAEAETALKSLMGVK